MISIVVVYEQDVGLKSSITVDTASRKDLTLEGCTNCPLQGSARTPLSLSYYPFYDLVPRDPKRQVTLTNNAQIRVAPRGVDTQSKSRPHSRIGLFRLTQVGLPGHLTWGQFLADRVDQQRNHVSTGPSCFKGYLLGATRQTYMHGLLMVNRLGPPLEMFEARKVRKGDTIASHTRLGTLSLGTNTRNSDPR